MKVKNLIHNLNKESILELFKTTGIEKQELFDTAYRIKVENVGRNVYLRGLIEISNLCNKNCLYCGIRRENTDLERYEMTRDEILSAAKWAYDSNYGSLVLQAGERCNESYIQFIEELLIDIKKQTDGKLGITLSLGEQDYKTFEKWFKAGAHRYLLRIETSNQDLYRKLHPENHDFDRRLECLNFLRDIGYQVGTGVMIGLPEQSTEDLADDILFFKKNDIDMIGMGPYIPHKDTPLSYLRESFSGEKQLDLTLKMIALTRLMIPDINIASTTALQTLDPEGREKGVLAGANILMPNLGSAHYKKLYFLYDDKPCSDDEAEFCKHCLQKRIESIGEKIRYNQWGDSPHFYRRIK